MRIIMPNPRIIDEEGNHRPSSYVGLTAEERKRRYMPTNKPLTHVCRRVEIEKETDASRGK